MEKEKVSIIIPIYNREKFLNICLDSVLNQSYKNLEIILVNDGSTDDSEKICLNYKKKDKRIKYIKQKNKGVSEARNVALNASNGNFISFIDSDDYVDKDYIKKLVNVLVDNDVDLAICNYNVVCNNESITGIKKIKSGKYNKNYYIENIVHLHKFEGYLWNKMYKRSLLIDDNGKFIQFDKDLKIREDLYYNLEVSKKINNVYYIDKCLYFYIQHNNNSLKKMNEKEYLMNT